MAQALIRLVGSDIFCSPAVDGVEPRLTFADAEKRLKAWASRYDNAVERENEAELAAIGREMFAWLDDAGWASAWAEGAGDRELEIRVRPGYSRGAALLDAPWELLASDAGALARDAIQLFSVARRVGDPVTPWVPRHNDLQLMFMAAAPGGQAELDFEHEEAAVLEATQGDERVHVVVEETGVLKFLGRRLASEEGPFEVLHLLCHGDIDEKRGPILLLETPEREADRADAGDLVQALGAEPPPLAVLSACRTAQGAGSGADVSAPFVRQLTAQVANVVGWDGSVYDRDATEFARTFYAELGRNSPVPRAAALARRVLLKAHAEDRERGHHWHLARVYLGPSGGGPLCAPGKPRRRARNDSAYLDMEKRRVPVATRAEFVGRRRAIQAVLRALRDGSGVLVHGMGALGKSSLAARVASRTPCRPVVIFGRYDALALFDEIVLALKPADRRPEIDAWREAVERDPALLADALESWLEEKLDGEPILLIVDDLERILQTPRPGDAAAAVAPASDYRAPLGAVLRAFARSRTASRLLLTSRYDLRLPDGAGRDLAANLVRVPLAPMPQRERRKQLRAAERLAGRETVGDDEAVPVLLGEALEAAAGNPGLQAILTRPVLAGEADPARAALAQIASYRNTGVPPVETQALIVSGAAKDSDNAVTAFFARLSFATYRDALTADQARQLAAATLFVAGTPVPRSAIEAAGAAFGVEDPAVAAERLLALGLFDDHGEIDGTAHAAANPLARPLAASLEPADRSRLARAAMPHLVTAWQHPDGSFPADERGLAAAEIALEAGADPGTLEAATFAGARWLGRVNGETRAALVLIERTLDAIPSGHAVKPGFLRLGVECADRLGEVELLDQLLRLPTSQLEPANTIDRGEHGALDLRRAGRLITTGDLVAAEQLTRDAQSQFQAIGDERASAVAAGQIADILTSRGELDEALRIRCEEELTVFERLGEVRERAVTMGKIADILTTRGELDAALRIRREEELTVFERLGEVRLRAVTMGKIAGILATRGELDAALRIYREEELPVYDRLGEVRERAVTMGKIADILTTRGELDEALRIRREEELPVYERLGEVRERAVTVSQIADILTTRGELDEALRIHRKEALPVFDRLGEVGAYAVTMGKIANILTARGELDEALRILREEALPVFDRLGEVGAYAVTMGKIADILTARGELDEALRIRREEQLPVYERLGDVRSRAVTMGKIADILTTRGELDEALRIRREEELPVFDRLGEVGAYAVTMGKIADILTARGELDEALRIRREEQLPVYERLGDVRSRAVTMGKIADILTTRGELDEALRIRREEELPVYDRLADVRECSVVLQKIAAGLLATGGLELGHAQEIVDAFGEAFDIARRLGLADGMAFVGVQFAEVLARLGRLDDALGVLNDAEAGFRKLDRAEGLARVAVWREAIRNAQQSEG